MRLTQATFRLATGETAESQEVTDWESIVEMARRLYETGGGVEAIVPLLHACERYRQPPPPWVADVVQELIDDVLNPPKAGKLGRLAKKHQEHRMLQIHLARADAVMLLKNSGCTWLEAYDRASEFFADRPEAGEPDTMKRSYEKVRRWMNAKPGEWLIVRRPG